MLPKKPKREDFIKSGTDTEWISYWTEWTIYERARAERAIEALKWYADHMGKSTSMDMRVFVQEAGNKAKQALAEIQASEEE